MLRQPYLTLSEPYAFEIEPIKHSRFIANAYPLIDEASVTDALNTIKARMPDIIG